jgi:hypothetical protein
MKLIYVLVGLLAGCLTLPSQAGMTTILTDNFDTGGATIDQNALLSSRQTGSLAPMAWDDLNNNTTGGVPDWDGRVSINANNQLEVYTGAGESALWNPGLKNLPQSSIYHVSWDQGNAGDGWTFVRFNSTTTGWSMDCGILTGGNWVQVFVNGSIVSNAQYYDLTPAGLHHIDVQVADGRMVVTIDGITLGGIDISNVGTKKAGIGYFSVFGYCPSNYTQSIIDNFEYQIPIAVWQTALTDNFNTGTTYDQNASLGIRQAGSLTPMLWGDLNYNTTALTPGWDGRVSINANGQLEIYTGGSESGFWNPGLKNLPQSSVYRISWDQGASGDGWTFVRFNSLDTGWGLECGILTGGEWVQVFVNGSIVSNGQYYNLTPAGLHHIDVLASNGTMVVTIDGITLGGIDISNVGTKKTGIGYFSVFGQCSGYSTLSYIDNVEYAVVVPDTPAPVFAPDVDAITGPTSITITAIDGATIYYTTDGSYPTPSSSVYTAPVMVDNGTTLKAIAVGTDTSWLTSRTYAYPSTATPKFSPGGKYITGPTSIVITSATQGAAIYYTTDGSEPTTSSTLYFSPISVNNGTVLKAMAAVGSYNPSSVASVTYVVPTSYNRPTMIPQGSAVVDGDLADWAGASWAPIDQNYNGTADDVIEAYYAAKWQANKVYVAVKVRDIAHKLTDTYTAWNSRDAIEVYLHTDNSGSASYTNATTAQQYIVGITNSNPNQVWTALGGGGVATALQGSNFSGIGSAAGRVSGYWMYYELELTPFQYLGFLETGNLATTVNSNLKTGDIIGLDVNVMAHDGSDFTGIKSENLLGNKHIDWTQFGLHRLASLIPGDANGDSMVDVGDLGILAANYGGSGKTWSQGDFNGDNMVDVGDLGILAANYGRGASTALDFSADYAKAFGATATDDASAQEEVNTSICSGLGLPLIAGLVLMGLMLVKLEE